jgi:hypothetical protein
MIGEALAFSAAVIEGLSAAPPAGLADACAEADRSAPASATVQTNVAIKRVKNKPVHLEPIDKNIRKFLPFPGSPALQGYTLSRTDGPTRFPCIL